MTFKVNWSKIKMAYQKGEGSCRILAKKYGSTPAAVTARCSREKWKKEKDEFARKVSEKVIEKASDKISDRAVAFVEDTIRRVERAKSDIDASREQFGEDEKGRVVMDMLNIRTMLHAESSVVEIGRQALGLPDKVAEVKHSGDVIIRVIDPFAESNEAD